MSNGSTGLSLGEAAAPMWCQLLTYSGVKVELPMDTNNRNTFLFSPASLSTVERRQEEAKKTTYISAFNVMALNVSMATGPP